MSVLLRVNNEPLPPHESVMPALHGVADTLLDHLARGKTDAARRFMSFQHLSPIALGFLAACLYKHGMGEKDIEAVLLH